MATPLALGDTLAGYRLLRRLGSGGHGTVFLAEPDVKQGAKVAAFGSAKDPPTNGGRRPAVALKVVPLAAGDAGAGFLRQAKDAQRLRHPGIVSLWAAGVQGSWAWMAMEPVPGSDMQRYTQSSRLLPEAVVLTVAAILADALAHAHAQGVVHRDLKPANVLVHWPKRLVKLADFGLARSAASETTQTGVLLGTPSYMAPEQLAGAVPDARSDTYALGVTLFELLTGQLPHQGHSMGELLQSLASSQAPALSSLRPELPHALGALLAHLLARDPARRAPDLAGVAEQLRDLAERLTRDMAPTAAGGVMSR